VRHAAASRPGAYNPNSSGPPMSAAERRDGTDAKRHEGGRQRQRIAQEDACCGWLDGVPRSAVLFAEIVTR